MCFLELSMDFAVGKIDEIELKKKKIAPRGGYTARSLRYLDSRLANVLM